MELFEQIRREFDHGVGTIKAVARKLGIHRRMVREALGDAVPRERKINTHGKRRIEPVHPAQETHFPERIPVAMGKAMRLYFPHFP